MDFHKLISANTGYCQICVGYIFAKNASSPRRDQVSTDLMHVIMRNNIHYPDSSFLGMQKYNPVTVVYEPNFPKQYVQ